MFLVKKITRDFSTRDPGIMVLYPITQMLRGAGIFTYMTGPYFWGKYVGRYSSTMEHLGIKLGIYPMKYPNVIANNSLLLLG